MIFTFACSFLKVEYSIESKQCWLVEIVKGQQRKWAGGSGGFGGGGGV